jgi:hypothetical protein
LKYFFIAKISIFFLIFFNKINLFFFWELNFTLFYLIFPQKKKKRPESMISHFCDRNIGLIFEYYNYLLVLLWIFLLIFILLRLRLFWSLFLRIMNSRIYYFNFDHFKKIKKFTFNLQVYFYKQTFFLITRYFSTFLSKLYYFI